jgi:hypothetical protein
MATSFPSLGLSYRREAYSIISSWTVHGGQNHSNIREKRGNFFILVSGKMSTYRELFCKLYTILSPSFAVFCQKYKIATTKYAHSKD